MQTQDRDRVTPNQLSYTREDWQRGYRSQPQESSYWIEDIEGNIPVELEGTLFRNGPGLLDINGYALHHPFDGDGMICAIGFKNGRAYFQNRFVRTEGFVAERQAKKPLYRGVFGTQKPGGWLANAFDLNFKNIANTNIIYWGDKLLALWEAAEPHRLDPISLNTLGLENLNGAIASGSPFSAHPRVDPNCNGEPRLVNFGLKAGMSSTITIYEFDLQGNLVEKHSRAIAGFAFIHDMAITPNYCIFSQNAVKFNPFPFLLGWRGAAECIQFDPKQPTKLILIPRHGKGEVKILETDPCFIFHHANAWEAGDEIILDSIAYEYFPTVEPNSDFRDIDFGSLPPSQLWRSRLNLSNGTVDRQILESRGCEFPVLNGDRVGRNYRYVYLGAAHQPTGNAPLQALLKLDLETGEEDFYSFAPRGFGGEPIFVPRPGGVDEDDGWVLVLAYNAAEHRSDLAIFDAKKVSQGPMTTLHLSYHIPYGLHGSFTPHYFDPKM